MTLAPPLRVLSSMAGRKLLGDLIAKLEATSQQRVSLESVGGVDAAKRVRAGEPLDVVVLAREVIDDLIGAARVAPGSRVDLWVSAIGVAVRAGAARPDISSAAGVKAAVLAARRVGYSTGPSGQYLAKLFAGWDTDGTLKDRITVAPPGVPVASLVARGDIDLAFQQLSELGGEGIDVLGPLPPEIQMITTFSGGVALTSTQPDAARALLASFASPALRSLKQAHGMDAP
ncbi:MAG TPA: substrate-binding domain-containing protein [Gammaproteobacteria bacterium]